MSDFNAGPVWDAAAPRLFPGQDVKWSPDGFALVKCVLGCAHKNGDARPSLQLRRAGGFRCLAFGRDGSLKDLVVQVLGADAWRELGRLGAGNGAGRDRTLQEVWDGLHPRESAWTDRFLLDVELSRRYLRSGRRWKSDLEIETHVAIYDAMGRLSAIKSRRPGGHLWPNGNDRDAKYRHAPGSKAAGLLFLADRLPAYPEATVVVVAGEKDALVAASHLDPKRWAPVSGCVGEGHVPHVAPLRGRRVVIAYDPDPAGRAGAAKLWRALEGVALERRVALMPEGNEAGLPPGEGKWDVAAVILAGGPATGGGRALEQILEAAVAELPPGWGEDAAPSSAAGSTPPSDRPPAPPGAGASPAAPAGPKKPRILVRPPMKLVVDQAEAALVASGEDVFQRGGQLVRLQRTPSTVAISPLPEPTLLEVLSDVAGWYRPGKEDETRVDPPRDVVRALAARGSWPAGLRRLEGVVRGPVLRLDGTVLDRPGYDAPSSLFFAPLPGVVWPRVPDHPTRDQAKAALDVLLELVADFPFTAPSDRSAWLALVLTLVARPAIAGPTPLFLVRAPTPGSGKTLLVEVASLIGTETDKLTTQPQVVDDDAEEQKALLTLGLKGTPLALIDNVDRPLGSAALASALTSRSVGGRVLGSNTHVEVPVPVLAATGNNVVVRADLARRVIPIDLDPGVERPEERTGFRIGNLATYAREHRAELRIAALTALRWYCAENRPQAPMRALGSYTEWTDLVRQTLVWLGQPDPCLGMDRIRESGDVEVESVRSILSMWWTAWGDDDMTALEIASSCGEELRDLLIGLGAGKNERIEARKLGYTLRRLAGRIMGGYRLERRSGHEKTVRWRVVNLAQPPKPDAPPTPAPSTSRREAASEPSWLEARELARDEDGWEPGRE